MREFFFSLQRARARPRPPPSALSTLQSHHHLFSLSTSPTGLQEKRYAKDPAKAKYGFFEITPYGITYAVAGLLYLWLAAPRLLPGASGRSAEEKAAARAALQGGGELSDAEGKATATALGSVPTIPEGGPTGGTGGAFAFKGRPFFAVRVTPGSPVAGASVRVAGLKGLDSLFLVATGRGGVLQHAVSPDSLLQEGDILYFSGDVRAAVGELAGKGLELLPADADAAGGKGGYGDASTTPLRLMSADGSPGNAAADAAEAGAPVALLPGGIKLLTAAVRKGGALDGVTVRESGIGARFGADIVSLTRYGSEQRPGRLADVRLKAGDRVVLAVPAPYEHRGDKPFAAAFAEAAPLAEGAERQVRRDEREKRREESMGEVDEGAARHHHPTRPLSHPPRPFFSLVSSSPACASPPAATPSSAKLSRMRACWACWAPAWSPLTARTGSACGARSWGRPPRWPGETRSGSRVAWRRSVF